MSRFVPGVDASVSQAGVPVSRRWASAIQVCKASAHRASMGPSTTPPAALAGGPPRQSSSRPAWLCAWGVAHAPDALVTCHDLEIAVMSKSRSFPVLSHVCEAVTATQHMTASG
jgi:hypothetical protein